MMKWVMMPTTVVALMAAIPAGSSAQERGWEPLVSESQQRGYEGNRYAPVVRVGDMLIASGVIGVSRDGDNSPRGQFRRALERVVEILEANGLDLADVAEITTYHVRLGELGDEFISVKDEFWPEPPYPAWTAVGVDRLFGARALIEIRFTAAMRPERP